MAKAARTAIIYLHYRQQEGGELGTGPTLPLLRRHSRYELYFYSLLIFRTQSCGHIETQSFWKRDSKHVLEKKQWAWVAELGVG